ncbi:hypothetical protein TRFO_06613 [Tritrichomonas foetus]|uniref:BTB domain-containing protein n=1 Tax=Tritrichomonas foetus TaxID=1144522 RepID=A0A1J4K1Z7_9EUKA|nr:hypothetical protein TRFO_06613 [Tritrichomonas foetus]|eukprot:OHT03764.1 hypothetical protein TRFO_06613 [Tritrichomonas foetus]
MIEDSRSNAGYFVDQSFTLLMGSQRHVFKGDLFAKMSKRCASLLEKGITEAAIMRRVDKDIFDAFVAACQLKPFKVTAKNAYELLYLAKEWEIASLEKFANDYINQKDLNPPAPKDYIQILADRSKEDTVEIDDIRAVAAEINDAFNDDRFIALPPEIIFQTILTADPHDVDPEKLLNFTMSLFDKKPSTGIPLTLLMNFEKLNPEQRSKIFTSPKMHVETLNYFIAWAITSIRNRACSETKELLNRSNFRVAKLADSIERARKSDKAKYHEDHDDELHQLTKQIADQEKELHELMELIENDANEEIEAEKTRQSTLEVNQDSVSEIQRVGNECQINVAGTNAQIRQIVKEMLSGLRTELDGEVEAVREDNDIKCTEILDQLKIPVKEQSNVITKLLERTTGLRTVIEKTNKEIHSAKCVLVAKVLRDKLRCDEFIRDTDKRFEIFNTSQKWDISPSEVEASDLIIEGFESNMNRLCPIRGNSNYSPPTSPKMVSPRKQQKEEPESPLSSQEKAESVHSSSTHREEEEEEEARITLSSSSGPLSPPQSP